MQRRANFAQTEILFLVFPLPSLTLPHRIGYNKRQPKVAGPVPRLPRRHRLLLDPGAELPVVPKE